MKLPQSFLLILLFSLSLSWGYGQVLNNHLCTDPIYFYRDADRDGWGTSDFTNADLQQARADFIDSGSPQNNLSVVGNVAYGCDPSPSFSNFSLKSGDLDDNNGCITNVTPTRFYRDADGDGYGSTTVSLTCSSQPNGYVLDNNDCDDGDSNKYPGKIWYYDGDGDGYGAPSPTKIQCDRPNHYVDNQAVYNDTTRNITNIPPQNFYRDADDNSYGNPAINVYYSVRPSGYVPNNQDCNDNNADLHPTTPWYYDGDGDGFGTRSSSGTATLKQCAQPEGYVQSNDDYDDSTTQISNIAPQNFYRDQDNDTYGDPNQVLF